MKSIRRIGIILGLAEALALPALGQVNTNATPVTTDMPTFLGDVWNVAVGQGMTNLSVTTYGTYTPSVKQWGGGLVLTRNLPLGHGVSTGVGIGMDYYASNFYALNGQVGLQADIRPLSSFGGFATNIVVTPFTFIGLGTPFGSGSGTASGNLETLAATGAAIHLAKVFGGDFSVLGIYGTRTGLDKASGVFYGAGLDLTWRF